MEQLRKAKGFICDMDGVIYHGNKILPGVKEFVEWLYRENKQFLFLTNNIPRPAGACCRGRAAGPASGRWPPEARYITLPEIPLIFSCSIPSKQTAIRALCFAKDIVSLCFGIYFSGLALSGATVSALPERAFCSYFYSSIYWTSSLEETVSSP